MGWSNDQFAGTLTIPTGATTGPRVVIDGTTGRIEVYDVNDDIVYVIDGQIPGATAGPAGSPQAIMGATPTLGYIQFPTNRAIEDHVSVLLAAVGNPGAVNEYATLQIQGPSVDGATGRFLFLINSQNDDGSSEPSVIIAHAPSGNTIAAFTETLTEFRHARVAVNPDADVFPCLWVDADSAHTGLLLYVSNDANGRFSIALDGRLTLTPEASALSAVFVNTESGHTGNLLRLQNNGTDEFRVDAGGVLDVYAENDFDTYTPVIAGGGTATFTTRDGYSQRLGKLIFVRAYFSVNAAGSGAANVTVTLPATPDRTVGRQNIPGGVRDGGVAGAGPIAALVFAGGAGAVIDRLVNSAGTDVTGALLTAGSVWTIEGWFREA